MDFIKWFIGIPNLYKMGLLSAVAVLFVPFVQRIQYRYWVKTRGKEYADEMARRW